MSEEVLYVNGGNTSRQQVCAGILGSGRSEIV